MTIDDNGIRLLRERLQREHPDMMTLMSIAYNAGQEIERSQCAELCEKMGAKGYGTLAIAAMIRERGTK